MTNDEADWLSDFLEAAQLTAKQSQLAASKDYAFKAKLLESRFMRAAPFDAEQEVARLIAASEALATKGSFDAAIDKLTEASAFARRLIATTPTETPPEPAASETAEAESFETPLEESSDAEPFAEPTSDGEAEGAAPPTEPAAEEDPWAALAESDAASTESESASTDLEPAAEPEPLNEAASASDQIENSPDADTEALESPDLSSETPGPAEADASGENMESADPGATADSTEASVETTEAKPAKRTRGEDDVS